MSIEDYDSWKREALQTLDDIDSGLSKVTSSLEAINQNILNFESRSISFQENIKKLDSANQFSLPNIGFQSVFQNISNDLSQANLSLIELGHDVEIAITLNYLTKEFIKAGDLIFEPIQRVVNEITLNIKQTGPIKIFTKANNASSSCHIVGTDQLGIEIQLSINFKVDTNNFDIDETSNPTLHLTLTASPIGEEKIQLSLTRGVRLCNQESLKQSFDQLFFLSRPQKEEYRTKLENVIVQAVSDNFPKIFSAPSIPKNQLIASTSIYNSYIQNYTRLFVRSKKRARQRFAFIQALPSWAELALKIDEQLIIDLIKHEVKKLKQGLELEGSPVIRPLENAIDFTIKKNVSKSRRIKIVNLPGDRLDVTTKVGVNVDAFIDFKLILKTTTSNKVRYDITQIDEPRVSDPEVEPVDVTNVPLVGNFIDDVIKDVVKVVTEIALLLAGTTNGEFDVFPNSGRIEISLKTDSLIVFIKTNS